MAQNLLEEVVYYLIIRFWIHVSKGLYSFSRQQAGLVLSVCVVVVVLVCGQVYSLKMSITIIFQTVF